LNKEEQAVKKVLLIPLALLLAISLVIIGCPAPPETTTPPDTTQPPEPETLRIGHLVALTEWFSVFDILQDREVQALAQMINEAGGITVQGQQYNIELVVEDFKSSLDGAAAGANKLVYDEKVDFVVGPFAFFSSASSPIFEAEQVLHVSTWNVLMPGEMDETTPYGFLGYHGIIGEFLGSIKAMKMVYPEVEKLAFVLPDDGAIPYLVPVVTDLAEDAGYTIVGETVGYPNEMTDFSPIAAKLNAIEDADAYFNLNGTPPHLASMVKGLRELGNTKPIIRDGNINCNDVLAIAGVAAATNVLTGGITAGLPENPPMVNEIYNRLEPQYGANTLNLENANGLYVLVQAIEAAQSLDPTEVRDAWEKMDTIDTLFGQGYMGGEEIYGIRHSVSNPHSIQQLIDGEIISHGWVEVGPVP
jgi:branched-chain amino acid transport system substrate-binding protein